MRNARLSLPLGVRILGVTALLALIALVGVFEPNQTDAQTLPSAPSGFILQQRQSATSIYVSWNAGTNADSYNVNITSDGGHSWSRHASFHSERTITINNLEAAKSYIVALQSINANGTSGWVNSDAIGAFIPANVFVVRGPTQMTVSWGNVQGATKYDINASSDDGWTWMNVATGHTSTTLNVTSSNWSDFAPGAPYTVAVRAVDSSDAAGPWKNSANTPGQNPPWPPTNVSASRSGTGINVTWGAPFQNGGSLINGYDVNYSTDGGDNWTRAHTGLSDSSTSATISNGSNADDYIVAVRANNDNGGSEWARSETVTGLDAPSNLQTTRSAGQIAVSWDAVTDATGYDVRYSWDYKANWTTDATNHTSTSKTITGLDNSLHYYVAVRAVNAHGGGNWVESDEIQTTGTLPAAPASVTIASRVSTSFTINWDSVNGATSYNVNLTDNGGSSWSRVKSSVTSTSFTVNSTSYSGFNANATYIASVQAVNTHGWSWWTNSAASTPGALPGTPASVAAHRGPNYIDVEWQHVSGATGYDVNYSSDDGSSWTRALSAVTGGTETTRTARITNVPNVDGHIVSVRGRNAWGHGGWANSDNVGFAEYPLSVTGLSTSRTTSGEIDVSWSTCNVTWTSCNGGTPITEYWVNLSSNSGTSWTRAKTVAAADFTSGDTITLTGTNDSTAYVVSVSMRTRMGGSWVNADAPQALSAPSSVSAYRGPDYIDVEWTHVTGATGYDVNYSSNGGSSWTRAFGNVSGGSGNTRTARVTNMPNVNGYLVAVRALNANAFSAWTNSNEVGFAQYPLPVTSISTERTVSGHLDVTWTICNLSWPSCTGGSPITEYWVNISSDNGVSWTRAKTIAASDFSSGATAILTGVDDSTVYKVAVSMRSRMGGSWVNVNVPAATTTQARVPRNLNAINAVPNVGTNVTTTFYWEKPAGASATDAFSYEIRCNSSSTSDWSSTTCPDDVASTTNQHNESFVTYNFASTSIRAALIRATSGGGNSLWVHVYPTPHTPTDNGAQYQDGALKVWWDRSTSEIGDTGYDVQCTTSSSTPYTWTDCHSEAASTTASFYVSPNAGNGVTNVRIRARQGQRVSEWVSSGVPSSVVPLGPDNVAVSNVTTQGTTVTYTIGWSKPANTSTRAVSYVVECSDDSSTTYSQCATVAATTATTLTATATRTTSQTAYTHVRVRGDEGNIRGGFTSAVVQVDYDTDDDGLIEVRNLAQLNAMRWDLNGNGIADNSSDRTKYSAAFSDPRESMGCAESANNNVCSGYELAADLDFDTNSNGNADSGDTYWNNGAGWTPIGDITTAFSTTFDGGGYKLSNLHINASTTAEDATPDIGGLFGRIGSGGTVKNLGLEDANVTVSSTQEDVIFVGALVADNRGTVFGVWSSGSITGSTDRVSTAAWVNAGGLVGRNDKGGSGNTAYEGIVRASYSHATITGKGNAQTTGAEARVGGLVGTNKGTISASFATGNVSATNATSGQKLYIGDAGGLVGDNRGTVIAAYATGAVSSYGDFVNAGGLVGENTSSGTVTATYSTGAVTGDANRGAAQEKIGGLIGKGGGTTTNSYWDNTTSGRSTSAGGTAKTTSELQTPTDYGTGSSIYVNWNVNVDGVTGNDEPWDFGTSVQYPILEYGTYLPVIVQRPISLTASSVTSSGATLTIVNHSGDWYIKKTAPSPAGTCSSSISGTTHTLSSLTASTAYTYKAFDTAGCAAANEIATVTFTTQ